MRASADDPRGFEEREVLQVATHLASAAHAREAYQLALALGSLPLEQREVLDERHLLIDDLLDPLEFAGSEATNPADARRLDAQRLLFERAAIDRLSSAPNAYVLSNTSEELARQSSLIEPLPRPGSVRVAVTPLAEPQHWKIDVACRDANALLAHLTEVLTGHGLDIVDATIATWPDGGVLDTFIVFSAMPPTARELAGDFEQSLRAPTPGPGRRWSDRRVQERCAAVAHRLRCRRARPARRPAGSERGVRTRRRGRAHGADRDQRPHHPRSLHRLRPSWPQARQCGHATRAPGPRRPSPSVDVCRYAV